MTAKPTITYVHRASSQSYRVVLSCGHRHTISKAAFQEKQWFVGKEVECLHCLISDPANKETLGGMADCVLTVERKQQLREALEKREKRA